MTVENTDFLQARLKTIRPMADSSMEIVEILNKLSAVEFRNSPETAKKYAEEALLISQSSGLESAMAESYHMYSITQWVTGEFTKATESSLQSLQLWEKLEDSRGVAKAYNNLGNIKRDQGNYSKALEYHLMSLKIKKEQKNSKGIANSNLNIGNIYKEQDYLEMAEEHYKTALEVYIKLDDDFGIGKCNNNIGIVKMRQNELEQALRYHIKALKIGTSLDDTRGIANSYGNMGLIYYRQKSYKKALDCYLKALDLGKGLGDHRSISASCLNVGRCHLKLDDIHSASRLFNEGMQIALEIGAKDLEATALGCMADLHQEEGNFKQAFLKERKHREINEHLFSEKSRNKIALLHVEFEMEKKQQEVNTNIMINSTLQKEIIEHKKAKEELKEYHDHLESIIQERTSELINANAVLDKSFKGTIFLISRIVEERDPYASYHQIRTADLASAIAENMGLTEEQVQTIYLASVVHEIGKIRVPQELLSRSGKLNSIELNIIRTYPQTGYEILSSIELPWSIADVVHQHREFLDGSGYPRGLRGDDIMLEAQILCIADTVEAMSSQRPYRPAFSISEALKQLTNNKGSLYDSRCVDACIQVIEHGLFKSREDFIESHEQKEKHMDKKK